MALRYLLIILAGFSLSARSAPLTSELKQCLFKKTVVVGASISANTAMMIPGLHTAVRVLALRKGILRVPDFGVSPVRHLLKNYAGNGFFAGAWKDYSRMVTNSEAGLGSSQIEALLAGDQSEVFKEASVIVGVDAFYWDAIWDNCGYGSGGAEHTIEKLTLAARSLNKKLILGNVPYEDPSKVLIDSDAIGIPGLWYQPTASCVKRINGALERFCHPQNGCYVIDLNAMATSLNNGEKLPLKNGEMHGLYSLRPDGVHLSVNGTLYVAEQIIDRLEANPPQCK